MPWSETCDKIYKPATIAASGMCSKCGSIMETGNLVKDEDEETVKVPWHFWVGVAAVIAYLGWRVIQGVGLLFW